MTLTEENGVNYLFSLSGGGRNVRAWDAEKGLVFWEYEMFPVVPLEGVASFEKRKAFDVKGKVVDTHCGTVRGHAADMTLVKEMQTGQTKQTQLLVLAGGKVVMVDIVNGNEKWVASLPTNYVNSYERVFHSKDFPDKVFVLGFKIPSTKVGSITIGLTVLSAKDGSVEKEVSFSLYYDGDFIGAENMSAIVVGGKNLLVTSTRSAAITNIDLGHASSSELALGGYLKDADVDVNVSLMGLCLPAGGKQFMLRMASNHHMLMQLERSLYSLQDFVDDIIPDSDTSLYGSYKSTFSASTSGDESLLARVRTAESAPVAGVFDMTTKIEFYDATTGVTSIAVETYQKVDLTGKRHGNIAKAFLKYMGGSKYVLGLISDSASFTFIENGNMKWTREEGLGAIKNVAFFDIPASKMELESLEDEFDYSEDVNMVMRFVHRLSSQLRRLTRFGSSASSKLSEEAKGFSESETSDIERDEFNTRKIVFAVSEYGKLFGIDSGTGNILWARYTGFNFIPTSTTINTLRLTGHLDAECVLVGKLGLNAQTSTLFVIDPITGVSPKGDGLVPLNFKVVQSMTPPVFDKEHRRIMLLQSASGAISVYPNSKNNIAKVHNERKGLYMFNVDVKRSQVKGYRVAGTGSQLSALQLWDLNFAEEKIVGFYSRSYKDRVSSLGRILADRNVAYKFLDPNAFVIATLTADGSMGVYVVDAVKGTVIFKCYHKNVRGPVNMVYIENVVVYHYYNTEFNRYEISVLEMDVDESSVVDKTTRSSFDIPSVLVGRQSYTFSSGIDAIDVTRTRQGIANKQVLLALRSGKVLAVDRKILDPRRVVGAKSMTPEMDALPYAPEVAIQPLSVINYNRTVEGVNGIETTFTDLESTSIVFTYGLDIFLTRATPSAAFDVLNDDFNTPLLLLTVVAAFVGAIVTQRIAGQKTLGKLWK
eukprot:Nk52_evm22s284 gene=Nk52_evmTU22s284